MTQGYGLQDKVVIVTGGAAGIGRATAMRFAEEGARISIWDMNAEAGAATLADLKQMNVEAMFQLVNVADADAVEKAVADIVSAWGHVDVLVNNAGITRDGQLVKYKEGVVTGTMSDANFDAVIGVNLKGVFVATRAVAPHMIKQGHGVILSASSVVAAYGNFGQTNYAATKAGLIAMTKTWARELGKYGIRVNAVAPGFTMTDMVAAMPEKVLEGMVAHTPMGRIGAPADIANAYVWLASDQAAFVHGTTLAVDGGLVLGT
ncbi:MAG: 3-oxoacyl-ACP reductase FabG [Caldiserica bacterium]|nr:3-oxoacyl-ACP reductase FabG [Caldisericota bacterium]